MKHGNKESVQQSLAAEAPKPLLCDGLAVRQHFDLEPDGSTQADVGLVHDHR